MNQELVDLDTSEITPHLVGEFLFLWCCLHVRGPNPCMSSTVIHWSWADHHLHHPAVVIYGGFYWRISGMWMLFLSYSNFLVSPTSSLSARKLMRYHPHPYLHYNYPYIPVYIYISHYIYCTYHIYIYYKIRKHNLSIPAGHLHHIPWLQLVGHPSTTDPSLSQY